MDQLTDFIHYTTIALTVAVNSISVGIGQGITSNTALAAINQQPNARGHITHTAILAMALIETAAIMGFFIALMLILSTYDVPYQHYTHIAEIGIALAISLSGFVLGIVSALPAQAACMAIARQPFFAQNITRFMLVTQSLIQTPILFGLIIAFFIKGQAAYATTMRDSLRLIGSGLCIGLGSIGPTYGLALFARQACKSLGINPKAYPKLITFTFISEALIETPIIFSLIISIILLFIVGSTHTENISDGLAFLAAALCTGLGTMGPGISSGKIAASACHQIGLKPDLNATLSRASMFGQGFIETCAIYAVLVSIMLIFFR